MSSAFMEWVIGVAGVIVLAGLGWASRGVLSKWTGRSSAPKPYAKIMESGTLRGVSQQEVTDMFAPFLEKRSEIRGTAKKLTNIARRYKETGKIDRSVLNSMATADLRAKDALSGAKALYERLIFEAGSALTPWQKIVSDLEDGGAAIEQAFDSIAATRQLIIDGKFLR